MEIPRAVPVMTLPSATLFPQALLPLYIFEPRYRQMLVDTLQAGRMFSVAMQRTDRIRESPCPVAGLGLIRVSVDHANGTSHLVLQGLTRVELGKTIQRKPYRVHAIRPLRAAPADNVHVDALVAKVHELVERRIKLGGLPFPFPGAAAAPSLVSQKASQPPFTPGDVADYLRGLPGPDQLADFVSCALLPEAEQRQALLETVEVEPRLRRLIHFLMAEIHRHRNTPSP